MLREPLNHCLRAPSREPLVEVARSDFVRVSLHFDARDFRVTEFAVSGSFLKQAYSLSYKLISHTVVGSVPPDTFSVPAQPGQIVIAGKGSHVPTHDVVVLSLRELTKLKQGQ